MVIERKQLRENLLFTKHSASQNYVIFIDFFKSFHKMNSWNIMYVRVEVAHQINVPSSC